MSDQNLKQKNDVRITFRAPINLQTVVKEFVKMDMHMNESDFYRDAARQKIKTEAPELYRKLFGS